MRTEVGVVKLGEFKAIEVDAAVVVLKAEVAEVDGLLIILTNERWEMRGELELEKWCKSKR